MSKSNSLTTAIIHYIKLNGGEAWRINVQGQYDNKLKIWRKSGMEKGFSDVHGLIFSIPLYVEIKIGKDKQSIEQKDFQMKVEKVGGYYFIAKDLPSFIIWINRKLKKNV